MLVFLCAVGMSAATTAASATTGSTAAATALLGLCFATAAAASATTGAAATATATTLDVGVRDDKATALETINVVDVGALNQRGAVCVYQDSDSTSVNNNVVTVSIRLKAKDVLCAAVATWCESNSKICVRRSLLVKNLFQLERRWFRDR